jgi:hypothetical protein
MYSAELTMAPVSPDLFGYLRIGCSHGYRSRDTVEDVFDEGRGCD